MIIYFTVLPISGSLRPLILGDQTTIVRTEPEAERINQNISIRKI
jgi:hypothetical protein